MEGNTRYIEDLSSWFMYLLLNADNWWIKMRHWLKAWTKWENVISVTCSQHLWSGPTPLTKSCTHLPHSLQSRNMTHNCSVMVAKATMWFWWETTPLNMLFWSLNSFLNCSLLQCYTIFRERSKFGRAKTCNK